MLADLFNAPEVCGTATIGSSEVNDASNPLQKQLSWDADVCGSDGATYGSPSLTQSFMLRPWKSTPFVGPSSKGFAANVPL